MSDQKKHSVKDIFIDGPIDPAFVGQSIAKHASRTDIGAHEIFLGQVRADAAAGAAELPNTRSVSAIEFSAYREMALERMFAIREEAFARWPSIICMHVHHSLGIVRAGEICFMVFASSGHRMAAREAVAWLVDRIKADLPIFGKEILSDATEIWKVNR